MIADRARIKVAAGRGGHGCVSFRREKYVPKGGPDGGDGGHGGSVIFRVNPHLRTLLDFQSRTRFEAPRGMNGSGNRRTGRSGEDLVIDVPAGTLVTDVESGFLLADLVAPEMTWVVARGGRGGKGNSNFATPTNQAPTHAKSGKEGEAREVRLELRLIADVGLVGFPNVGKSTLLATLSAARPKIADYPFTTLEPHLGFVRVGEERSFVMADLPGLIEGASEGKGLGLEFLRHVWRTRVLLILIDSLSEDPAKDLRTLRRELREYHEDLTRKPAIVALSRADLVAGAPSAEDPPPFALDGAIWGGSLSGATGKGTATLLERLWGVLVASEDPAPDRPGQVSPAEA